MSISFFAVRDNKRANGFLVVGNKMWEARSGRNLSDVSAERLAYEDGKKTRKLKPGEHPFIDYRSEKGDVPPGNYELGGPLGLNHDNLLTMTSDGKANPKWRKFPILPTDSTRLPGGDRNDVRDARYPGVARTHLLFHYDGDTIGSAGCIVYDKFEVQLALQAAYDSRDRSQRSVRVVHVTTLAEARRLAQQAAGLLASEDAPAQ